MASTSACYKLFREKQKEGHGEAIMFKGEWLWGLGRKQEPRETQEDGHMSSLSPSAQPHLPGHVAYSGACEATMVARNPGFSCPLLEPSGPSSHSYCH
jgi:hypothetical protein